LDSKDEILAYALLGCTRVRYLVFATVLGFALPTSAAPREQAAKTGRPGGEALIVKPAKRSSTVNGMRKAKLKASSSMKTERALKPHSMLPSGQSSLSHLGSLLDAPRTLRHVPTRPASKVSRSRTHRRATALEMLRNQMDLLEVQGKI
jgi:hypothetical protein